MLNCSVNLKKVFKIGLTGGIGSGKSSLLSYLKKKHNTITLDLDKLAFLNYKLNKWSILNLQNRFGQESVIYDSSNKLKFEVN